MERRVFEELKALGIPRFFVVTLDAQGQYNVTNGFTGQRYEKAEECIIFYNLHGVWSIRHIDKRHYVHHEYIAGHGYHVSINSYGEFCIYKDKDCLSRVQIDVDHFPESFDKMRNDLTEIITGPQD